MKKIIFLSIFLFLFFGCTAEEKQETNLQTEVETQLPERTAKIGDTVRVDYIGRFEDGKIFDQSQPEKPLEFSLGSGQVIQGFEEAVFGMKEGETKTVSIPPEKGYGQKNSANIVEVEKTRFKEDANYLRVGQQVTASTGATGLIVGIYGATVKIDFNHELAGKTLVFEITLKEIVESNK